MPPDVCSLQLAWHTALRCLSRSKARVCVLVEGMDGAGKTSLIRHLMKHTSPKYVKRIALDKPTKTEKSQWFMQRYLAHLPHAGQVVFFDRSWYTRPLVESVYGWCTPEQAMLALHAIAWIEACLVADGMHCIKLWLDIASTTQQQRLQARRKDARKWWQYSAADQKAGQTYEPLLAQRNRVLTATSRNFAPWLVVDGNDKRLARQTVMQWLLAVPLAHFVPQPGIAEPEPEAIELWVPSPPDVSEVTPSPHMPFVVMDGMHTTQ